MLFNNSHHISVSVPTASKAMISGAGE